MRIEIYAYSPGEEAFVKECQEALNDKDNKFIRKDVVSFILTSFSNASIQRRRESCGSCGLELINGECQFCDKPKALPSHE